MRVIEKFSLGRFASSTVFTIAATLMFAAGVAQSQQLEEIVVTAQKREIGLQSAPVAVTAFTGKSLERNRIFSISDLATF